MRKAGIFDVNFYQSFGIWNLWNIFYFIIAVILALLISYLFSFFIGALACWFVVTWPLNMMVTAIHKLLSGAWIPIWLFPSLLSTITACFPFKYIYYVPAYLISDKTSNLQEIWGLLLGQCIWVVILFLTVLLTWKIGSRRIMIHGG